MTAVPAPAPVEERESDRNMSFTSVLMVRALISHTTTAIHSAIRTNLVL